MSIRQAIFMSVLELAEKAERNREDSFTFMGAHFVLNRVSDREVFLSSGGKYAGVRIFDGIAELA